MMPFGDSSTFLNGTLFVMNENSEAQPIMKIQDISELSIDDEKSESAITLDKNWNAEFSFKVAYPWTWRKLWTRMMGWRAKGPYRKRLLNRLIYRR